MAGFGTLARAGSFGITPQRYEWSAASCPGSGGAPAPGSKFVVVYAAGRNDGSAAADVPAQQWSLDGYPALSPGQAPCQPEGQPLAVACLAGSRLAPDARCEGWVLFQVPQAVTVEGATVGVLGGAAGQWRLPG